MHIDIWSALIAGFFSIISPVIFYLLKQRWDQRNFSSKRVTEITGNWRGFLTQRIQGNKNVETIPVSAIFDVKGKIINVIIFLETDTTSARLEGHGSFPHDDIFVVNYSNKDDKKKQFGCFIAHLGPTGNEIVGKISGYGYVSDDLVSGDFIINRVS